MKVWIIGRDYPRAENNRLGSFELEQAKILARAGLEVTYLVADPRSFIKWRRFGCSKAMEEGVTVATISVPAGGLISPRKISPLRRRMFERLMRYLARKDGLPDIIHVHYPSTFLYRLLQPYQKQGVRIAATEHWSRVQEKSIGGWILENLKEYTQKADAFCCVGSALVKSVREMTGTEREIPVIPNVLFGDFRPLAEEHEGLRFLAIGRMVAIKRYDVLVEAFLEAFRDRPDVTLTIAGNGPEMARVREIVRQKDEKRQVLLPGLVPHEKMAGLIASSDAFVGFSVLETFCVPVVEAWACGKPVIVSDTTTVFTDNPDARLGMAVDWRSPQELQEAMIKMADTYETYDPEWICRYADSHFTEKVYCEKMLAVYRGMLGVTGRAQ